MKFIYYIIIVIVINSCGNMNSKLITEKYLINKNIYNEIRDSFKLQIEDSSIFYKLSYIYTGKNSYAIFYTDSIDYKQNQIIKFSDNLEFKVVDFMYKYSLTSISLLKNKIIYTHQFNDKIFEISQYFIKPIYGNIIDSNSAIISRKW
jgi:hypothetical protein